MLRNINVFQTLVVGLATANHSAEHVLSGETQPAESERQDASAAPDTDKKSAAPDSDREKSAAPDTDQEKSEAKLLFPVVYSSTLTVFSIQSVTSTIPFTCFNCEWRTASGGGW